MQTSDNLNDLISDIREKQVVLWVGSGFSHYAGYPTGTELAEIIKSNASQTEIKHIQGLKGLDVVAQEFVTLKGSRNELEAILQDVFTKDPDYTSYHEMVAKIPHFKQIITTNYDTLFERIYGDEINVIFRDDQIKQTIDGKKVNLYKIHGDINNPDSILITEDDYVKFFSVNRISLLWNEITSIVSKYTLLFIGYSISDINIKYIFEYIFSKLNVADAKIYLIAPGIPEHKQREFKKKYGVRYIDLYAEEAIPLILEKIQRNLIIDTNSGLLDPESTIKCLVAQNIDATFCMGANGAMLSTLSSQGGGPPLTVNFKVRIPDSTNSILFRNIQNLLSGELVEELTLPSDVVELTFQPKIGNILILDPNKTEHQALTIRPNPLEVFNAELRLRKSGKRFLNVKGERYVTPTKGHLKFIHPMFKMSFSAYKNKKEKASFNFQFPGLEDIAQANEIYEFFFTWMNGDDLLIFTEFSDPVSTFPSRYLHQTDEIQGIIGWGYQFTSKANKIQTYFGIKLHIEVDKICKHDLEALEDIVDAIDNKKRRTSRVIFNMNDKQLLRNWLEQGVPDLVFHLDHSNKYSLFGREFTIQGIQFDGKNLIIENPGEVTKLLSGNADEIPVTLTCSDGTIEFGFNSVTMSK